MIDLNDPLRDPLLTIVDEIRSLRAHLDARIDAIAYEEQSTHDDVSALRAEMERALARFESQRLAIEAIQRRLRRDTDPAPSNGSGQPL